MFSSKITICPVADGLPVFARIGMGCGASKEGTATLILIIKKLEARAPHTPTRTSRLEVEKLPLGWMDEDMGTHQHSQVGFLVGRAKETANNIG